MVWGIVMDYRSHEHAPNGKWVGYEDRLTEYFKNDMPDGLLKERLRWPLSYVAHASKKFSKEIGSITDKFVPIEPLLPHEWPDTYQTEETPKKLGAFIVTNGGFFLVEERLKAVLDELEPGVHDFRPIRIILPRGKDYPMAYYAIRIGNFRNSFRPDLSDSDSVFGAPDNYTAHTSKKAFAGVAMSVDEIDDAHLWRERTLTGPRICMSDQLHDAIVKAGLSMMTHYKMKSV
jgi:hypothetical protein